MSPRRQRADRWPWPEDGPMRRREKVAQGYRELLLQECPEKARVLDERCAEWGQTWVLGTHRRLPEDELLDTAAVADHFDVQPRTVDQWHHRDGLAAIDTPDGVRYRYGTIIVFLQQRRRRRRADT